MLKENRFSINSNFSLVDAAKDLLENPNIPVSMVASELGYSNFSHFTQMFKKHENVTPSEAIAKKFIQEEFIYIHINNKNIFNIVGDIALW
jgi:AraC-like DNA-binding protein